MKMPLLIHQMKRQVEVEEETEEDKQSTKLSPYDAQNYFNSTMGGKDLQVLFVMVVS